MEISTTARRSGRLARVLVNLICLVAVFGALLFIIPAAFGLQRYVITGTSMSGSIDRGSVVFSEVVPVTDLEVGDVITYQPPSETGIDHLVTHRIVAIEDDQFRTKGDAVPEADPWTFELESASQARVEYDIPYVGWIFIGLQDRIDADHRHRHPGGHHRADEPGPAGPRPTPLAGSRGDPHRSPSRRLREWLSP